jgi:ribonuclease HI
MEFIESTPVPWGTTSQKAELIALTRALTLAKDKKANIYTDSKYAYHIIHHHIVLWEERGFLTTKGTPITNGSLILKLLKASYLSTMVVVIHCKGHQPETTEIAQGNAFTDNKAKRASTQTPPLVFITSLRVSPTYTPEKRTKFTNLGATSGPQGWLLLNEKFILPVSQAKQILKAIHKTLILSPFSCHSCN